MKIGDIVSLISGGPRMTVQNIKRAAFGRQSAHCVWFEKNKLARAVFDVSVLMKSIPEGNGQDF